MLFNTTVLYGGLGLLVLQAIEAYRIGMLTPRQMMAKGYPQGLPFLAHGGMWGDIVVTLLLAYIVRSCGEQWRLPSVISAIVFGLSLSGVMHWSYTQISLPESHVLEHRLTLVGWLHFIFMGFAIGILTLFFLNTENPSKSLMWWTAGTLSIHLMIGNHFVLGLFRPRWYQLQPLTSPVGWATVIIGSVALAALTYWRVGV